jgi:hypothetical protein
MKRNAMWSFIASYINIIHEDDDKPHSQGPWAGLDQPEYAQQEFDLVLQG